MPKVEMEDKRRRVKAESQVRIRIILNRIAALAIKSGMCRKHANEMCAEIAAYCERMMSAEADPVVNEVAREATTDGAMNIDPRELGPNFNPDHIFLEGDRFIFRDGDRAVDVTHLPVWWLCENGHEWQASLAVRVSHQKVCPQCAEMSKNHLN